MYRLGFARWLVCLLVFVHCLVSVVVGFWCAVACSCVIVLFGCMIDLSCVRLVGECDVCLFVLCVVRVLFLVFDLLCV